MTQKYKLTFISLSMWWEWPTSGKLWGVYVIPPVGLWTCCYVSGFCPLFLWSWFGVLIFDSNFISAFFFFFFFLMLYLPHQLQVQVIKKSLVDETLCKKWLSLHKEMISAKFLWWNELLGEELQIDAKNSNFEFYESALYMKSESIPLTIV